MSQEEAKLVLHPELCRQQAKVAAALAEDADTAEHKADYLKLATEWLRVAEELEKVG